MNTRRIATVAAFLTIAVLVVTTMQSSEVPRVAANPLGGIVQIAAGEGHTCAVTADGNVKCWGSNSEGQLGNGEAADLHTAEPIPANTNDIGERAVAVSAGFYHTCALTEMGGVSCWGDNHAGQLGGERENRASPGAVPGLSGPARAVSAGGSHTCALIQDGTAYCWGQNSYGQLGTNVPACFFTVCHGVPAPIEGVSEAVAIAAGVEHTCVILSSGRVRCWGRNDAGQLGDGSGLNRSRPVDVVGLAGIVGLTAGSSHTCALSGKGAVWCWGLQYGNVPVALPALSSGVVEIRAMLTHTCALLSAGSVQCWGDNGFGQLGDDQRCGAICLVPTRVLGLEDGVALGMGLYHSCAVLGSGGAKCWGNNFDGQLGNGQSGVDLFSAVPVDVVERSPKPPPTSTPCPTSGCPTATPRPSPPQTGLEFSISVDADANGLPECGTAPGLAPHCELPQGVVFDVITTLHSLPRDLSGYGGFDIAMQFAGLESNRKSDVIWPDCGFPVAKQIDSLIVIGCATSVGVPSSSFVGDIAVSQFTCSRPGSVTLLHRAGYTDLVSLSLNSYREAGPDEEQVMVTCGDAIAGDVDCNVSVDPRDASLMLQRDAAVVRLLGCPQQGDVNIDQHLDAIDAAVTLQYSAGLVGSLPVVR
jgi:alpha-tubulin suppressor-like RCC1 family protein